MGCATPGTRVAFTVPGQTAEGGSTPGLIYVVDYYAVAQTAAWGETQDVPDGFPEVELEEGGEPIVTIPDDFDIPETTEIATRELGDGATVGLGDVVFVQYRGVKASDGEEFDSSWSRGEPTSFSTDAVIEGFTKALVGQTVGSQVIAVIPAEEAYGTELGTHDLAGEDLVFVIDILDSMSAPGA
nr:FKBP-type peptidyl-prolyl cis-trans isomerase [Microbacterium amylolyticum]